MQSLFVAALVLSVAALPAPDIKNVSDPDVIQRSPQPTKPPKNKQPYANLGSIPTLTIPTFTFVPLSISIPTLSYNIPKKAFPPSQSTVYVPVYIPTGSLSTGTASRWSPPPSPPSPTWPSEPSHTSEPWLGWNHESSHAQSNDYIPAPSFVSPAVYIPTTSHVAPAVYVPAPDSTPSFVVSQSIAPVLTTIMVTVTRGGAGAPPNLGTLMPQPPKSKKGGDAFDDEDWK